MKKRHWWLVLVLLIPAAFHFYTRATYPSDHTPEGAYLRVVQAVNEGKPENFFAYTEETAQHACFSIRNYRRDSLELAAKTFPKEEHAKLQEEYGELAGAADGSDAFALIVRREDWLSQLRLDMSGIKSVEQNGPRATIETAKGTRYSLRVRPNGIWGLTGFTPALAEEAERAARDFDQVKKAAEDFARERAARAKENSGSSPPKQD